MKPIKLTLALLLSTLILISCREKKEIQKPNVLFIAVDDLRPELGCYGKNVHSPNIDKLASEALVFTRSYCNIAVCGASRASIMTGLYPTRTRFTSYLTRIDEDAPGITSLPGHFKNNGYYTASFGKIFHHLDDGLSSWSETPWRADYVDLHSQEYWRDYRNEENLWTKVDSVPLGLAGPAWEKGNVPDNAYYDGKMAESAVEKIKELAKMNQPFFFGVGFLKPHLPFNAPAKYWDLYTSEEIELAPNPFFPENAPDEARFNYGELRAYSNIPNNSEPLDDETSRWLKHGYYACVSYTDALIGKVLDALEETGQAENTIVILWGDHGFSLGEHTHWCKHTCFHNAMHTPLIIKAPEYAGGKTTALASYVDIYPTLCELAGIEVPVHLQGESLAGIMKHPEKTGGTEFTRYPHGETIVTGNFTYTEYYDKNNGSYLSNMLYDLKKDPEENKNVAGEEEYAEVVNELRTRLRAHVGKINP
jgi:arylsulfatase A-like enzyme